MRGSHRIRTVSKSPVPSLYLGQVSYIRFGCVKIDRTREFRLKVQVCWRDSTCGPSARVARVYVQTLCILSVFAPSYRPDERFTLRDKMDRGRAVFWL